MENKLIRQLNCYYYGMLVLTVAAATICYLLITRGVVDIIDRMSALGRAIQYLVIINAITSIPLGLYGFKRKCDAIRMMEDIGAKTKMYKKHAAIRIVLVSQSMCFGIAAYYLLGCYMSMFWIAAIGAIGWYFTKPTEKKIYLELNAPIDNEEKY